VGRGEEGGGEGRAEVVGEGEEMRAKVVVISARVEAELRELDPDEAEEMRHELGIERSGLERLIRAAFDLLDLISFFTADTGKEAMARTLRRGGPAPAAAGRGHTPIPRALLPAAVS